MSSPMITAGILRSNGTHLAVQQHVQEVGGSGKLVATPSPISEAYATMWYGDTRSSFGGDMQQNGGRELGDGGGNDACTLTTGQFAPPPEDPTNQTLWRQVLDDLLLAGRRAATWNNYYDDLATLLRWKMAGLHGWTKAGKLRTMRVIEIGTMYGGASQRILQQLPETVDHFVVDPFLSGYDDAGDSTSVKLGEFARSKGISPFQLSHAWAQAMAFDFHRRFGCRYHLLHAKSLDAAPLFTNGSMDAIFVDGLHTYDGALNDIRAWWPKLNPRGGVMIFNDYGTHAFPGVMRAVRNFMHPMGLLERVGAKGRPPGHRNAFVVRWPLPPEGES